ncbi:MAG: hypothetical protein QM728_13365 [Gordonia sp. (in: high G+C Gram-positive bacteria)]|uniref:hypothetical protein n=1 Tax=Gordonia sp. (in: high G+C Gram-positive bacteria) TaxID=84139 RepID=UPI0039E3E8EB
MTHVRPLLARLSATAIAVAVAVSLPVAAAKASKPEVGQPCSGAEIGRKVTDAQGRKIMCSNYRWQLDKGQSPIHPWIDDQRRQFGVNGAEPHRN